MLCPICGRENPENAKKCSNCGTRFRALARSTAPKPKKKPGMKPWLLPCAAIALVLCIGVGLVRLLPGPSADVPPSSSTTKPPAVITPPVFNTTVPTNTTGPAITEPPVSEPPVAEIGTHIPFVGGVEVGNIASQTVIAFPNSSHHRNGTCVRTEYSLDGQVAAILYEDGSLHMASKGKLYAVAENVTDYKLSVSGNGVAYTVENKNGTDSLCLYILSEDQAYLVHSLSFKLVDYCISPDGKTVAYQYVDSLWVYNVTDYSKRFVAICQDALIAISNDGHEIYVRSSGSTLICYTANYSQLIMSDVSSHLWFNADHSQLLFHKDGFTYLADGPDVRQFVEGEFHPVLPNNAQSMEHEAYSTVPFHSFYRHGYVDDQLVFTFVTEGPTQPTFKKLQADQYTLDPTGQYLFCAYGSIVSYFPVYDLSKTQALGYNIKTGSFQLDTVSTDGQWIHFCYIVGTELCYGTLNMALGTNSHVALVSFTETDDIYRLCDGILYHILDDYTLVAYGDPHTKKYDIICLGVYKTPGGAVLIETPDKICILCNDELIPFMDLYVLS